MENGGLGEGGKRIEKCFAVIKYRFNVAFMLVFSILFPHSPNPPFSISQQVGASPLGGSRGGLYPYLVESYGAVVVVQEVTLARLIVGRGKRETV